MKACSRNGWNGVQRESTGDGAPRPEEHHLTLRFPHSTTLSLSLSRSLSLSLSLSRSVSYPSLSLSFSLSLSLFCSCRSYHSLSSLAFSFFHYLYIYMYIYREENERERDIYVPPNVEHRLIFLSTGLRTPLSLGPDCSKIEFEKNIYIKTTSSDSGFLPLNPSPRFAKNSSFK